MGFKPFIADGSADGCHMNANFLGDLLHLQRLNKFRPPIEELFLMLDDRLSGSCQRAAALFNGFNQPLSGHQFAFDVLFFFSGSFFGRKPLPVIIADVQAPSRPFFHLDDVVAFVVRFQPHVGRNRRHVFIHELTGGTRIKVPQLLPSFVDFVNRQSSGLLDLRDSIVSQVFQMVHD